MNNDIKRECILDSVRRWVECNGYQEITDDESYNFYTDIAFQKGNRVTGFLLIAHENEIKLNGRIAFARSLCDYIFVINCNTSTPSEFEELIPNEFGILSYVKDSYKTIREPRLIY